LGEAPSFGKPIIEYDPNGIGSISYRALAMEFLSRELGQETFADTPGVAAI
jgi:chromosome partitioning protein